MSRVFVAEESRLRRKVVIKVLSPDLVQGFSAERFEREIQLAASLSQANIVPVLSAGETDGLPFFTMPFVDGESLRHRLTAGPLPIADVVGILRDVARALGYAHRRGIVHRDIKPDNVLLSSGTAVVTDFGIAKAISAARTEVGNSQLTQTGTSIGTPAYMAPEQAAGDPDLSAQADFYAFGCMAYELLSGRVPFIGESAQRVIAAQLTETPRPITELRPDTPPMLAALTMRCLAKAPADRPADADEVMRVLSEIHVSGEGAAPARAAARTKVSPRAIAAIVVVIALLAAGGFWLTRNSAGSAGSAAAAAARSLAVLPIVNAGGDSSKEYLADGMTSELAGNLRQTPGLAVVGDLSTFRFKHSQLAPSEIARQLGVQLLLTGTLQSQGSSIRLRMQLNDAAGKLLWSNSYDRRMQDNFALEDQVAGAITREMQTVLSPTQLAVARAGRTTNPEAHDLYLRGMFEKNKLSQQGLTNAVTYFKQALALDSSYAQAWAGLAFAYDMQADVYMPSHPTHLLAKDAAAHALRSDSMLADAHVMYGFELAAADWDIPGGTAEMKHGLELDPNSPDALFMYSSFLGLIGQTDSAVVIADRLIRVDPLSAAASAAKVMALGFGGRWAAALKQDSVTKRLDPSVAYGDAWDAAALRELGNLPASVTAYQAYESLSGGQPAFGLAITYGRMGRRDDAMQIIRALEAERTRTGVDPGFIAAAYAGLGDSDNAMKWLDTGLREKSWVLRFLMSTNPGWLTGVRDDPRFPALRQRVLATTFNQ
jgi:serine/threonine-protein kinase